MRGADDHGAGIMRCSACHQSANQPIANIPGAPRWGMAPRPMRWGGLTVGELCRTLKDRGKNGNRSLEAIRGHMTADPLVMWAWNAGAGRKPPPISLADLRIQLSLWISGGAPCPN